MGGRAAAAVLALAMLAAACGGEAEETTVPTAVASSTTAPTTTSSSTTTSTSTTTTSTILPPTTTTTTLLDPFTADPMQVTGLGPACNPGACSAGQVAVWPLATYQWRAVRGVLGLLTLDDPPGRLWSYSGFDLAYVGGLLREIVYRTALKVSRLDMLRRTIPVEETLTEVSGHLAFGPPKTAAARRTVTLPKTLIEVLAAHLAEYPAGEEGLIFTAPARGPLRVTQFRNRVWYPAVAASVGKPCRFHDLRHTAAALLIREGVHPNHPAAAWARLHPDDSGCLRVCV